MTIEVTLDFISAGTYGFDSKGRYSVPAHGITLNTELMESECFRANFKLFSKIYSVLSTQDEENIFIFSLNYVHDFFKELYAFLQTHKAKFQVMPENIDKLLLKLVKEERLTASEHDKYFDDFRNIYPLPFKKYTALKIKSASMAIELAEIEQDNSQHCLNWLIHSYNFGSQHPDYIAGHKKISELISDIPVSEFEILFNQAKLPFWLMQLKADLESNQSQQDKHSNTVFEQVLSISTSNTTVNERIEGLKQARVLSSEHPFLLSPFMIADYLTGVEQEAQELLFLESSDSSWLLDVLAINQYEIEIKIDDTILQNEIAQANIGYYLRQTNALIRVNIDIAEAGKDNLMRVLPQVLENIQTLEILDLSNLALESHELENVLNILKIQQLYKFKILNLKNCSLTGKIDNELKPFIEKCMHIKAIVLDGNMLDAAHIGVINKLIRQGSPIGFFHKILKSEPELEEMAAHNNGGSDDLFLENKQVEICFIIDAILVKLNSGLSIFKSPKYQPLCFLRNAFSLKSNTKTYKTLLIEMTDSKGVLKKNGLTNTFKLFINGCKEMDNDQLRLLEITKSLLKTIQTENNVQLDQAIYRVQTIINEKNAQNTLSLIDGSDGY